jgi:hypothetical protein
MTDLTSLQEIQGLLKDNLVPKALQALGERLEARDPESDELKATPADIKLTISLAREFGVDWDTATGVKAAGGKKLILEGFNREQA